MKNNRYCKKVTYNDGHAEILPLNRVETELCRALDRRSVGLPFSLLPTFNVGNNPYNK